MERDTVARPCPSLEGSSDEVPQIPVTDIDKGYTNSDWRSGWQLAGSTSVKWVG